MVKDEQSPVARLIPISSASRVEAQERRAASALLAIIGAVTEVGRALLKPLGASAGFNAILSISNHYVTSSADYSIEYDRRKLCKDDNKLREIGPWKSSPYSLELLAHCLRSAL
jgi:hypothetical protein